MDLRRKIGVAITVSLAIAVPSLATAADASYQGFLASGATAGALEAKINDFLLTKSVQDFGYSIYQQGRTYGSQQESVSSTPQLNFVNKHKNAYCSPNITAEATGALQCKAPQGVSPADAKYLELGDINFSTVADPTVYTQLTDLTAQNLIRNIISPFPDPKIAASIANNSFMSDGTKKKEYADYMAGQAILGVALYSMNEIYGARVPGSSFGLSGGAANASWMSTLQSQATQRYEKPDFAQYLADPATTQLMVLKELAAMEAFRLWFDYQRYLQAERMEALLAAALAKMVNDSYSQNSLVQSVSSPSNLQSSQ